MGNSNEPKPRARKFREWLQLTIIVLAALLGAWEFILKDVIRPANRPTALNISASMEIVGRKDSLLMIKSTVETSNPTDRRIYVPAFWHVVRGYGLSTDDLSYKADHKELIASNPDFTTLVTYTPFNSSEVVAQQRICFEGSEWWEPDDKTHDEIIFTIPTRLYDYLDMQVTYFHTRDISKLDTPQWTTLEDGSWNVELQLKHKTADDEAIEEWQRISASGYNWYVTTLPLWND